MDQVPSEVIQQIMLVLPYTDLTNYGSTCRHIRRLYRDDTVWRRKYIDDFGQPTGITPVRSWHMLYEQQLRQTYSVLIVRGYYDLKLVYYATYERAKEAIYRFIRAAVLEQVYLGYVPPDRLWYVGNWNSRSDTTVSQELLQLADQYIQRLFDSQEFDLCCKVTVNCSTLTELDYVGFHTHTVYINKEKYRIQILRGARSLI